MPYIAAVATVILFVVGLYWPMQWFGIAFGLGAVPILVTVIMRQPQWRMEYVGLSAPMVILLLSTYAFLLIQEEWWLQLAAGSIAVICLLLFEKHVSVFLYQPSRYIPYSLEHVSIYSTMVAAFFCYVSLAMFAVLHISRLRYLFVFAALLTAIMVWQAFWIQKISFSTMWRFILVITVVMTEGLIVFYFWPVSFFASGGLLTLMLYFMLNISRHHLMQTLTRRLLIRYGVISLMAVLLIVSTAQWTYI